MLLLLNKLAQAQCTHPQEQRSCRRDDTHHSIDCRHMHKVLIHGPRCNQPHWRHREKLKQVQVSTGAGVMCSRTSAGAVFPTAKCEMYTTTGAGAALPADRRKVLAHGRRSNVELGWCDILHHRRRSNVGLGWCDVLDDRHSRTLRVLAWCTSPLLYNVSAARNSSQKVRRRNVSVARQNLKG